MTKTDNQKIEEVCSRLDREENLDRVMNMMAEIFGTNHWHKEIMEQFLEDVNASKR